jgi:hypothetical protein
MSFSDRMSRAEWLTFCRARALEYVENGHLPLAMSSMCSDLNKHAETRGIPTHYSEGMKAAIDGDTAKLRAWIATFT